MESAHEHEERQLEALRKKTLPTFVAAALIFILVTSAITALWMLVIQTMRGA